MITQFISRAGIAGTRCAKRLARAATTASNAQLGLKKSLSQQIFQTHNYTVLAAQTSYSSFSPVTAQILSIVDPSTAGRRMLQTKGDKELVDFLDEEISAEKKIHKKLPDVSPFAASFNDAEVILTRKTSNETIIIKFNVNNSVDTDEASDVDSEKEQTQMTSRPNFTVEIERGCKVLSLACSFAEQPYDEEQPQQEANYADLFSINELSVYEGDFSETTYSSAGDILDENLYDHLMNMLEDRGVTNEFVQKLSDYSTAYEHQRYISLLENLKNFFN